MSDLATIRIPTPLQNLTEGKAEIEAEAQNLATLIEVLNQNYPGIKERLIDESGEIRRFVNIYINDEDVRFLNGLKSDLDDKAIVSIVPAVAGG